MEAKILQRTLVLLQPHLNHFVYKFYESLFTKNTEIKSLLAYVNIEQQEKRMISALLLVIQSIERRDFLDNILRNLVNKYLNSQVVADYYPLIGEAFLETLKRYLGSEWTPKVEENWKQAYQIISDLILASTQDKYQFPYYSSYLSSFQSNSQMMPKDNPIK